MKTKLPKATRLPSGSFRCQVTAPEGKRISVTAETAQEAQAKAVAIKAGLMESGKKGRKKTLSQAIDEWFADVFYWDFFFLVKKEAIAPGSGGYRLSASGLIVQSRLVLFFL